MPEQTCLRLEIGPERLEIGGEPGPALWPELPEERRRSIVNQLARLIARASQAVASKQGAEKR